MAKRDFSILGESPGNRKQFSSFLLCCCFPCRMVSQLEAILPPRGYLAISGDILVVATEEYNWLLRNRHQNPAILPIMNKMNPTMRNYPA